VETAIIFTLSGMFMMEIHLSSDTLQAKK